LDVEADSSIEISNLIIIYIMILQDVVTYAKTNFFVSYAPGSKLAKEHNLDQFYPKKYGIALNFSLWLPLT
jgi:hypothetical protein